LAFAKRRVAVSNALPGYTTFHFQPHGNGEVQRRPEAPALDSFNYFAPMRNSPASLDRWLR
jgi:hypothetical protein